MPALSIGRHDDESPSGSRHAVWRADLRDGNRVAECPSYDARQTAGPERPILPLSTTSLTEGDSRCGESSSPSVPGCLDWGEGLCIWCG